MKREFIKGLLPDIDKEILDKIMDEAAKDVQAKQQDITNLTTERDVLQSQLNDAHKTIRSYENMDIEGIKKSASDLIYIFHSDTKLSSNCRPPNV